MPSKSKQQYDKERAALRYQKQRQDPEWVKRHNARSKARYKPKGRTYSQNKKAKNKQLVRTYKLAAGSCMDCGLVITEHNLYKFDFDHREPKLKRFQLSAPSTRSTESVLDEIAKCDVVCRNCHSDRTHLLRRDETRAHIAEARQRQRIGNQPRLFDAIN
jgi:hypothetical protein